VPYDVDAVDAIPGGTPSHDAHTTVDMNGDGALDLVVTMDPANAGNAFGGAASPHWAVYFGLASGFAPTATDWALPANLSAFAHAPASSTDTDAHATMDIDGDGILDLVVTTDPRSAGNAFGGTSAPYWAAYLGTGSGFANAVSDWSLPANLSVLSHEPASATDTDAHATTDMDGDGVPDLVVTMDPANAGHAFGGAASPHWNVYLGNGAGFAATPTSWSLPADLTALAHTPGRSGDTDAHATLDIDGDGHPDLVISADPTSAGNAFGGPAAPHWQVYLGTGSGFAAMPMAWNLPANLSTLDHAPADASDADAHTTVDMDGDGILDLVITMDPASGGNAFGATRGTPYWQIYKGAASGFVPTPSQWKLPANISVFSHSPANGADTDAHTTVDVAGAGCPDLLVTMDPANLGHAYPGPSWHLFAAN
jgi:hypothetical protein